MEKVNLSNVFLHYVIRLKYCIEYHDVLRKVTVIQGPHAVWKITSEAGVQVKCSFISIQMWKSRKTRRV